MLRNLVEVALLSAALTEIGAVQTTEGQMLARYRYDLGYWSPTVGYTPYNLHYDYYQQHFLRAPYSVYRAYPYSDEYEPLPGYFGDYVPGAYYYP